ncbi:MAG: UDP-3-O-acyl-N-acetylglucosamine deacetylase [Bacteroidales bacterium]|nr:UDP-3-O-acyl-N-acetylglucosamine deacetylase [Bacteroidales bacterium]
MEKQTTLKGSANFEGKGLHTGAYVHLSINPAPADYGFRFRRVDIDGNPEIHALATRVSFTQRGTVLTGDNKETISTIEHLMSALRANGVDNCRIDLDGPEVPILDGSAKPFTDAIRNVGLQPQDAERQYLVITRKAVYEEKEKGLRIIALPEDYFAAEVNIAFDGTRCLPNQWAQIESLTDEYDQIYDCRTFVFLHEIAPLLNMGLIKGGDLDNAIVFVEGQLTDDQKTELAQKLGRKDVTIHPSGALNDRDLKYANEPARHKLLDLIGDLALVGRPIKGRILATRSGHGSNTAFARQLIKEFLS